MELRVWPGGQIQTLYDEMIPLHSLGRLAIRRAGRVEPDEQGRWWADLGPVNGPRLGPFPQRSAALAEENRWLLTGWFPGLTSPPD